MGLLDIFENMKYVRNVNKISEQFSSCSDKLKDFFYTNLVMDILSGNVVDKYNKVYTELKVRNIINSFPIQADAKTVNGRMMNTAVSVYVCSSTSTLTTLNDNNIHKDNRIYHTYIALLNRLGYSNSDILNIEYVIKHSGLNPSMFDSNYSTHIDETVRKINKQLMF